MKHALKFATNMVVALGSLILSGCAHFQSQPLAPDRSSAGFNTRSLNDAGLADYFRSNHITGEWPRKVWSLEDLTLAAFYFQPSLDVARAKWAVTKAGHVTAGERPNPILSVSPAYNSTTTIPSPWVVTPSLDIPIEVAGKRGYRIAQSQHLSEAARINIASVAWQVRSEVRKSLVNLCIAHERESILGEQQTIQEELCHLLELQLKAGAISPFEAAQARIAAGTTRLAWHDAKGRSAECRVQLARAIGIPTRALDQTAVSPDGIPGTLTNIDSVTMRRQALLNRTDILGALAEYSAIQSALQLEIAKQYPDIHLNPGYEFDQGDNKWSLGLSIELPILNHNRGAIAEATARRAEAAARFNALQATVVADVDQALAARQSALLKLVDAESMVSNLEGQEKSARARLEAGDISRVELAGIQLQRSMGALSRLDTVAQSRLAEGQLEDALQSPILPPPSAEQSPRATP